MVVESISIIIERWEWRIEIARKSEDIQGIRVWEGRADIEDSKWDDKAQKVEEHLIEVRISIRMN